MEKPPDFDRESSNQYQSVDGPPTAGLVSPRMGTLAATITRNKAVGLDELPGHINPEALSSPFESDRASDERDADFVTEDQLLGRKPVTGSAEHR